MGRAKVGVLAAMALVSSACAPATPTTTAAAAPLTLSPRVRPSPALPTSDCAPSVIAGEDVRLGLLSFEVGYQLTGVTRHFGGLSGLEAISDTTLLAVADSGWMVQLTLSDDAATPVSCRRAQLQAADGSALSTKAEADAEGLAWLGDGHAAVSFERQHRIETFDVRPLITAPATTSVHRLPQQVRASTSTISFANASLGNNRGLEALAVLPSGALLAGAESPTLLGSPHPVWRIPQAQGLDAPWNAPAEPTFEIATEPGFGLVGFDVTPHGNVVTLERFYTREFGNRIKIGWIPGDVAETTTEKVFVRELGRLTTSDAIPVDNFEGIAAVTGEDGRTDIWIISDDNFNASQKTLLYRFSFDEEALMAGDES